MIKRYQIRDRNYVMARPRRLLIDVKWYSRYIPEALVGLLLAGFILALPIVGTMLISYH